MEDTTGGAIPSATSQPTPQAPAPSAPAPAPAPSPAPAAPSAQGAAQPSPGVLDQLRSYGLEGNFQTEQQALQHLAQVARQASEWRQLAGYGQQYLQHQQEFQEFQRQRQEQQARQQAQQQSWWKAPEYDPSWLSKVYRDPQTGELRSLPGHDPLIVQKLMAWTDHQRGFLDRFAQDPMKAIQPGIEQLIDQRAQQLIQQHLGGYQERSQARQIVSQHGSWIYERGNDGQPLRDPATNQPVLNEWGKRYAHYVAQAESMGVRSVEQQNELALALVRGDYATMQARQAAGQGQAQSQGDQAREQFLQQAAGGVRQPNAAQPTPAQPSTGQTRSAGASGLAQLLAKNLQSNGYGPGSVIDVVR